MPSIEFGDRYQRAVLWVQTGVDSYGEPITDPPVELRVRWIEGPIDVLRADGTHIVANARVQVFRDLAIGDLLWLGKLTDWYGSGSGGDDDGVMRVATWEKTPDLKGRMFLRYANLVKHKDTPT